MNEQATVDHGLGIAILGSLESDAAALKWITSRRDALLRGGFPASRVITTALATTRISNQFQDENNKNLIVGIHGLMSCLIRSELRVLGRERTRVAAGPDRWNDAFFSFGDQSESLLLGKDARNGFTLIEGGIKTFEGISKGYGGDQEIVEGVRLGAKIYKRLFPLAAAVID